MGRRFDANRIKKAYPYIRRKPEYRFVGNAEKFDYVLEPTVETDVFSLHEIDSTNINFIQQRELNLFDFSDGKTGLTGFTFIDKPNLNAIEGAITFTGISDLTDSDEVGKESNAVDLFFEIDSTNSDYIIPKV
tara:strand:- start:280 stop:678 length:399 start_codon:yes stop_codon:yes gene_type:complete